MNSLYLQHHQPLHKLRLHNISSSSPSPSPSPSACKLFHNVAPKLQASSRFTKHHLNRNNNHLLFHNSHYQSRLFCNYNDYTDSDIMSQLELGKPGKKQKPEKRVNGIFWILLLNLGIYAADHVFQVRSIKSLYLYHDFPVWYQFVTSTFCHYNWQHLSSNLFFLYIFGKLVEEEEGNFALWLSYIITGAGANLVSWLLLPRNVVSVGASGAVFGLFAISVLVRMSWDWRKILEVLILGQFVIERVMEAAQGSSRLAGNFQGVNNTLMNVNHIAHLSGALVGVVLIWLLTRIPSPSDDYTSKTPKEKK